MDQSYSDNNIQQTQNSMPPAAPVAPTPNKSNKTPIIILSILLIASVTVSIVLAAMLLTGNGNSNSSNGSGGNSSQSQNDNSNNGGSSDNNDSSDITLTSITVPGWGIKFDLHGAKHVTYRYNSNTTTAKMRIWLTAPDCELTGDLLDFANPDKNNTSQATLEFRKTPYDENSVEYSASSGELIYTIPNGGGYVYYWSLQQGYRADDDEYPKEAGAAEMAAVDFLSKNILIPSNFSLVSE